jgi:hypothetical protein
MWKRAGKNEGGGGNVGVNSININEGERLVAEPRRRREERRRGEREKG